MQELQEALGGPDPAGEQVGHWEGGEEAEIESQGYRLVLTEGIQDRWPTTKNININ